MATKQLLTPNLRVPATRGWCLMYVDDAIKAPKRQPTAQMALNIERNAKRLKGGKPPVGIWVILFFSLNRGPFAGLGHVAFAKNHGSWIEIHDSETRPGARPVYSSIEQVIKWFGAAECRYEGYSYSVDGRTIAQDYTPPAKKTGRIAVKKGTAKVQVKELNVRDKPSTKGKIVATYSKGQTFVYDSYQIADGFVWLSYISYSGQRRFVAEGVYDGKKNSNLYVSGGVG